METSNSTLVVLRPEELQSLMEIAIRKALCDYGAAHQGKPHDKEDRRLTFDEVRVRLRLSRPTVLGLIKSGQLSAHKTSDSGQWIISERALEAYLAKGSA